MTQVADLQRRFAVAEAERDRAAAMAAAAAEREKRMAACADDDSGHSSRPWVPAAQLPTSST